VLFSFYTLFFKPITTGFLQGCLAVAIHGGKDMEERIRAIAEFKAMKKDILGNNLYLFF
jgi:hypothetical protein